jgi:hypothetical protein
VLASTLVLSLGLAASSAEKKTDAADSAESTEPEAPHGKKAKEPAGPKVIVLDKGELRAEASDIGKVLKKLHKKEKLEFLEWSSDAKWVKVRKGKVEGWVLTEQLDSLPPLPEGDTKDATAQTPPAKDGTGPAADAKSAAAEAKAAPAVVPEAPPPPKPPEPPKPSPDELKTAQTAAGGFGPNNRPPLSGVWISVGGGVSLLGSSIGATTQSGLVPELFNYEISTLPALGLQASVGYTFAYKALRVGIDAGYRFAGATSIIVQLPNKDSLPTIGQGGTMTSQVLATPRQQIQTSSHDADASFSIGGYIALPKQLDLSIRARGGVELFAFLPEFNGKTPLPQESFYGPHIGAAVDFASRYVLGFGVRVNGGYIPYAVRQENAGLRDGSQDTSTGYYFGAAAAFRVLRGLDIEVAYRLLGTNTSYLAGSNPERLKYDRDPTIQARAASELLADGAFRSTSQQTITLGLVFLRQ